MVIGTAQHCSQANQNKLGIKTTQRRQKEASSVAINSSSSELYLSLASGSAREWKRNRSFEFISIIHFLSRPAVWASLLKSPSASVIQLNSPNRIFPLFFYLPSLYVPYKFGHAKSYRSSPLTCLSNLAETSNVLQPFLRQRQLSPQYQLLLVQYASTFISIRW